MSVEVPVQAMDGFADGIAMNWKKSASEVRWNIRPFVGGDYRVSTSTECFENLNPATESAICRVPVGSSSDVDEAVRVARKRFEDGCWSELPTVRRAEALLKLADLVELKKGELALLDCLEMGKPISASLYDAEQFAPAVLRSSAGFADKLLGACAPLHPSTLSYNSYQARGVVGAITPWNFPIVNAAVKVAPALAAGNTVVLKPSELSSSSALRLAELALEAGIPEGVFNVVPGLGATVGTALALHPDVDLLSFTGSTATGRRIMQLAGQSNGKPLLLECGGKSPQIVFDDVVDVSRVAAEVVRSAFWNQGQVCSARTRLLVHAHVKDALLEEVKRRAEEYRPGDPLEESTNFGPLASPAQRDRVKGFIEQGRRAGALELLKAEIREAGGCFVSPAIFDRVDSSMSIAREEIFGPVLCVQSFESDEQALSIANATDYGLGATVWTRDMGRAKRFAYAVKVGSVTVRTSGREAPPTGCSLGYEPQKASGFGSEIGLTGLQAYSTLKSVSFYGI